MFDSASLYGCQPQTASVGIGAPTESMGSDSLTPGWKGLLDPHSPLVWFGGILLVTVGAASAAGSVRLGKGTLSVSAGK